MYKEKPKTHYGKRIIVRPRSRSPTTHAHNVTVRTRYALARSIVDNVNARHPEKASSANGSLSCYSPIKNPQRPHTLAKTPPGNYYAVTSAAARAQFTPPTQTYKATQTYFRRLANITPYDTHIFLTYHCENYKHDNTR